MCIPAAELPTEIGIAFNLLPIDQLVGCSTTLCAAYDVS